jgi:CubicO group peptidase (beta-lactamase class C family)
MLRGILMVWLAGLCGATIRPAILAASLFVSLTGLGLAREAKDRQQDATSASTQASLAPSDLPAVLATKYSTLRALVLARGNCSIFEYYGRSVDAETQSPAFSVTKSVLSILVGIAIDEGDLRLDEKLSEIVPEAFNEKVDARARDITVRDVLTKTEGFAETGSGRPGPPGSGIWSWMLNRPIKYPPGTRFRYDGIGSDLLSAVLSHAIKQNAADFARRKLFDPLQIRNYFWPSDTEGYLDGESGLLLTGRDMAKIGLLYLHHGRWEDKQIISDAYVQDSTKTHNDGGPPVKAAAYGYQWWVSKTRSGADAFFASGRNSQLIYVVPKLDLVVAMSADSIPGGGQGFVNDIVLPAVADPSSAAPCITELEQGALDKGRP